MTNGGEAKERFDLAKLSYDQVLDATKHQDDKVGRFLTAIAFLTAAAITFGSKTEVLQVRYDLDGPLTLPAFLFAGFLVFVAITVLVLLMALGQPLRPPGSSKSGTRSPSRLFFVVISGMNEAEWSELWDHPAPEISAEMTASLIGETYNIATRAETKYRHLGEAQALFTMALLLLVLALTLAVKGLAATGPAQTRRWDLEGRLIASGVSAAFALALGYGWVRTEERNPHVPARWTMHAMTLLAMAFPALVLLPPRVLPVGTGAVLAASVMVLAAFCWRNRWPSDNRLTTVMSLLALALAVGSAVAVALEAERWRLGIVCLSVALFEMPRLLFASFRQRPAA